MAIRGISVRMMGGGSICIVLVGKNYDARKNGVGGRFICLMAGKRKSDIFITMSLIYYCFILMLCVDNC